VSNQEKLQNGSSMPNATTTDEGQQNLENCLTALDQSGEPGLQEALDRLYPRIVRKPILGGNSWAL
jgi:hypothetical protein